MGASAAHLAGVHKRGASASCFSPYVNVLSAFSRQTNPAFSRTDRCLNAGCDIIAAALDDLTAHVGFREVGENGRRGADRQRLEI